MQKTTGTTLNNAGIGVVLIGSAACGTDGLRRQAIVTCGVDHRPAWCGMTANGLTKGQPHSNAGEVTGKRVPCGRTCLIWRHRLATYLKGPRHGCGGYRRYLRRRDAQVQRLAAHRLRRGRCIYHPVGWARHEQVALFSTSDVSALAASIEAYATENLGITTPTKGT